MRSFLVPIASLLLLPSLVAAQSASTAIAHVMAARTPYTAEYKVTSVVARPDGTTVNYVSSEVRAVDAQGREMREQIGTPRNGKSPTTSVSVFDPVAHTLTNWNSLLKQATMQSLGGSSVLLGCATAKLLTDAINREQSRQRSTVEDLGLKTIAGIEAHGTRTTFTTPPARDDGNEAPFVTVIEKWTAVDVRLKGLPVREMTDHSPGHSGSTRDLTSLKQGDPDPALFTPPSDYEIVREQATCKLKDW
jgi:hypothetical protein